MVFPGPFPRPHPSGPHPPAERVVPGAEHASQLRRLRRQHRLQPRGCSAASGAADGDRRARFRPLRSMAQGSRRRRLAGPCRGRRVHRAGLHHDGSRRQPDHGLSPGCDEPLAPERRRPGRRHARSAIVAPDGRDGHGRARRAVRRGGHPDAVRPGPGAADVRRRRAARLRRRSPPGSRSTTTRASCCPSARAFRTARSRARCAR